MSDACGFDESRSHGSDESNADGLQEATIVVYRPKTNNCCISSSAVRMTRLFAE
jgi:hypothetical protein